MAGIPRRTDHFVPWVVVVVAMVLCTSHAGANVMYESGEEKSEAYARNEESSMSSHQQYTRVSDPDGQQRPPRVPPPVPGQAGSSSSSYSTEVRHGSGRDAAQYDASAGSSQYGSRRYSSYSSSGSGSQMGGHGSSSDGAGSSQQGSRSYSSHSSSGGQMGGQDSSSDSSGSSQYGSRSSGSQQQTGGSYSSHSSSGGTGSGSSQQQGSGSYSSYSSSSSGSQMGGQGSSSDSSESSQYGSRSYGSHSSSGSQQQPGGGYRPSSSSGGTGSGSSQQQGSRSYSSHSSSGSQMGGQDSSSDSSGSSQHGSRRYGSHSSSGSRHQTGHSSSSSSGGTGSGSVQQPGSRTSSVRSSSGGGGVDQPSGGYRSSSSRQSSSYSGRQSGGSSSSSSSVSVRSSSSDSSGRESGNEASRQDSRVSGRDSAVSGRSPDSAGSSSSSSSSSSSTKSRGTMSELERSSATAADTEQRGYFKRLISQRCKPCEVNGKKYQGHSRFEYEEGCNKYRCVCSCQGAYNCPARYTIDICKENQRTRGSTRGEAQETKSEQTGAATGTSHRQTGEASSSTSHRQTGEASSSTSHRQTGEASSSTSHRQTGAATGTSHRQTGAATGTSHRQTGEASSSTSHRQTGEASSSSSHRQTGEATSSSSHRQTGEATSSSRRQTGEATDTSRRQRQRGRGRETRRRRRCDKCTAYGQEFKGNAYFDVQSGCMKYRGCVCYCNGTWNCPSERSVNTCEEVTERPPCAACNAKGKVVPGNSYFEMEEPCKKFRYCRCLCDGSWSCPEHFVKNTCQSPTPPPRGDDDAIPGCQRCNAKGKEVKGNSYFNLKVGCIQYKHCVCRCNGSWSCPDRYARNDCKDQEQQGGQASSTSAATSVTPSPFIAECQSCFAHNRYIRGNTYFSSRKGCTYYDRCVCRCDGSWDCPRRYASNLCTDDDPTNDVEKDMCSDCEADSRIISTNTIFNMTKDCVEHSQCLCHCDGKWSCPERFQRNVCQQPTETQAPDIPEVAEECGTCLVDGRRVVRGNTRFDFVTGCFKYRDCLCTCDGKYKCSPERAQNICTRNRTRGGSSQDSSSSSSSSSSAAATTCRRCFAYGQFHAPNSRFTHQSGCYEHGCDCHCNGTVTCPAELTRKTCEEKQTCQECELRGQFFEGNTYFRHTQGCVQYLCTCYCNGTYDCPADRANTTGCAEGEAEAARAVGRATVTDVGTSGQDRESCTECRTDDGRYHSPGTDFTLQEGCIKYKCRCNCDGSWNCPGDTARNICRGEELGGCRSCVISDSQIYHGDEDFQMREGCIHYMCRCNCDGSWECPGEQARDICLGEVPGGCRVCRVSENETFRGETKFPLRQGCIHYTCNCNCNGSWDCPGDTSRDVCIGEVPGGCRVCKLDNGQVYLGESDFQMTNSCIHYKCRCNCDGSWNCPGETARRVCKADDSRPRPGAYRPTQGTVQESRCRRCVVSQAEQFQPNRAFMLKRGCNEYECQCKCDGSWHCPGEKARNVCARRENPVLRAQTCDSCTVSSYVYPGRSSFLLTRGCNQYNCECDCSGRWSCNHTVATNICTAQGELPGPGGRGSRLTSSGGAFSTVRVSQPQAASGLASDVVRQVVRTSRGSSVPAANLGSFVPQVPTRPACVPCRVEGTSYPPDQAFVIEKKCKRFNCFCSCNGRWRCPRADRVNLCPSGTKYQGGSGRRTATSYSQTSGAGGQGYGRTDIRVIGAGTSANAGSGRREGGQVDRMNVRGYYIDSRKQTGQQYAGTQTHGQQQSGSYQVSGQQGYDATQQNQRRQRQYGPNQYGQDQYNVDDQNPNQYNAQSQPARDQYGTGQGQNMNQNRHGVQSHRTSQSASSAVALTSSSQESNSGSSGVESNRCTPCQVDEKVYRAGAKFDWRRGCLIYRCSCLCSGSYRCAVTIDNNCSATEQAAARKGGLPTGPITSGASANQPGSGCGNCYVHGFVYPGNMSFTLKQGCDELKCRCGCDGNHECAEQKPIPGCTAVATPLGGPAYPYGMSPVVYPMVHTGSKPVMPGRIVSGYQQVLYQTGGGAGGVNCPTCQQSAGGGGGGAMLIPAGQHNTQVYTDQHVAQSMLGGAYPLTDTRHHVAQPADPSVPRRTGDHTCASCFVDGQSRQGSFEYSKDCFLLKCYCDCSGWLRCSVQPAKEAQCTQQPGPMNRQGCRSCVIQGNEYPPSLQFAMRIGCYGYDCSCGCDGQWMCYSQQPTNYCVRPASSAARGQPQADHPHGRGTAELKDRTEVMLNCVDCDVRGTVYPSRTKFLLRDGCQQHTCDCECDGSWSCQKNQTVNVCSEDRKNREQGRGEQQEPGRPEARGREEGDGSQETDEKERALAETAARQAKMAAALTDASCRSCQVNGKTYLTETDFRYRQGCRLFSCHCFCNGTWECPASRTRDVCQSDYGRDGCRQCHVRDKTYPGGSEFTYREGCWEFGCRCGCNGEADCPPTRSRDMCRAEGGERSDGAASLRDAGGASGDATQCKPCFVDGQVIRSRTAFNHRLGCTEFLCQCACNGTWFCPKDQSYNDCEHEESKEGQQSSDGATVKHKGCKVGRKTYFTRLFAYTEGCMQHMCICYDSGAWRCPLGKVRDIC